MLAEASTKLPQPTAMDLGRQDKSVCEKPLRIRHLFDESYRRKVQLRQSRRPPGHAANLCLVQQEPRLCHPDRNDRHRRMSWYHGIDAAPNLLESQSGSL